MPRALLCCLLALTALAVLAPGVALGQAPRSGERVAAGVSAAGVDVSGLTLRQAADRINASFRGFLERNVAVRVGGRTHRLSMERARFAFDHLRTAKRALYAGRKLDGGDTVDVPLAIAHSHRAVRSFARDLHVRYARRSRNASVRVGLKRVTLRRAKVGRSARPTQLAERIDAALDDRSASRQIRWALKKVYPPTNANDIRREYRTVLTIDRRTKRLRLFKNLKLAKTYRIAVGAAGHETPRGLFRITTKQVNPAWHAPNRSWAGAYAGKTIPPGDPRNPLKARWMGIVNGVGIHGTAEEWSIGSSASHGCIRMRVSDVKQLYPRVPIGTRVRIS